MDVGSLSATVDVKGLDKLDKMMDELKASMDKMVKSMDAMAQASTKVAKQAADAAAAKKKFREEADRASSSSANLGRTIREMTTSMLGTSTAAIALGTAIGNLATQAVSRLILGLIDSVTQFARIRNELAQTAIFLGNVGEEFQFVAQQAALTRTSLQTQADAWTALARQAQNAGIPLEVARKAMEDWNKAVAANTVETLSSSFGRLMTNVGNFFAELDNRTGFSGALIKIMNAISTGIERLVGVLPKAESELEATKRTLKFINEEIDRMNKGSKTTLAGTWGDVSVQVDQAAQAASQYLMLLQNQRDLIEEIQAIQAKDPAKVVERFIAMNTLNETLKHEIDLGRHKADEQERLNRLFAIQEQFRQMGIPLNEAELEYYREKVKLQQASNNFQGIVQSLQFETALEMENFRIRMDQLTTYLRAKEASIEESNALIEAEFYRSNFKMLEIQRKFDQLLINARMATAQAGLGLLQNLAQRSKAFAVAAVVVGKGMAIAQAIQQTTVASLAALAPPPVGLGPVAGAPLSASIKAYGAAQIALIAATGALEIGQALKGGGPSGGGGGGGGGALPITPEPGETGPSGRTVTLVLKKGMLFSSEQMQEVIDQLNEEVKNGATLIATEVAA